MLRHICLLVLSFSLLLAAGCTDQSKIDKVKKAVVPNCSGKTMDDLGSSLLQDPVWGLEKDAAGTPVVTLQGTVAGDKLPMWVKEQNLLNVTFRFPLDAKTGEFDPTTLDGFPSMTTPEGIFQTYKLFVCS